MCNNCFDFVRIAGSYTVAGKENVCSGTATEIGGPITLAFCADVDYPINADRLDRYVWRSLADELLAKGVITIAQRAQFETSGAAVDAAAIVQLGRLLLGQLGGYFLPVMPGFQQDTLTRLEAMAPNFLLATLPLINVYERLCDCRDANGNRAWLEDGSCYQIVDGAVVPCP